MDNDKIIVKVNDKEIEINYTPDEEIETNFIEDDLEKTLDLTEKLKDLENTLILDGELSNE
mgnify:CR=1 FL=1